MTFNIYRQKKMSALVISIALAMCAGLASNVKAQCGTSPRQNLSVLNAATTAKLSNAMLDQSGDSRVSGPTDDPSLVGLWDVKFMVNGQLYDEVFDQFHADGNEVAIDIVPPVSGNVCLGLWTKSTIARGFNVKHPFWIFDPATNTTLIGRGLISQRINLSRRGNSFTGTFKIQFRDLNGQSLPGFDDPTGNLLGDRIEND